MLLAPTLLHLSTLVLKIADDQGWMLHVTVLAPKPFALHFTHLTLKMFSPADFIFPDFVTECIERVNTEISVYLLTILCSDLVWWHTPLWISVSSRPAWFTE